MDTGPEYPPGPLPGSNGIGEFVIGVSPIGIIPDFDVWKTIISQYANSPILTRLIENIFDYLDQTANFAAFFDFIFNVDTAQGYGLDVWGRIVGVNRVIAVAVGGELGFEEALPGSETFGEGSFSTGIGLTTNYSLSDSAFRQLIFAKAAANITDGSIPAINRILMSLFPNRGNAYVTDGQKFGTWFGFKESTTGEGFGQETFYVGAALPTMTMQYVFDFQLTPVELTIVGSSGVLPKPVGVQASIVINP